MSKRVAGARVLVLLLAAASCAIATARAQELLHEIHGSASGAMMGLGLSDAGDVDQDGFADFLVGEPFGATGGAESGRAILLSGATGAPLFEVAGKPGDWMGYAVAGLGDVNADGRPDFVVGAPQAGSLGSVTVYSGADRSVLRVLQGVQAGGWFGAFLRGLGDLDGDQRPDLGVSAPAEGVVRIYSSRDWSVIRAHGQLEGVAPNGIRIELDDAGDADQDGVRDVVVGEPFYGDAYRGRATIFSGSDGSVLQQWLGDTVNSATFGYSVAGIGDFNHDGHDDVLIGIPNKQYPPHLSGEVRVYSGSSGIMLMKRRGEEQSETLGRAVCNAGDIDGDGTPDFLVAAPYYDDAVGEVSLFSGSTRRVMYLFDGDESDPGPRFGWVVSGAGDVNGDGFGDLVVAATDEDNSTGVVRVFAGNDVFLGGEERELNVGDQLDLTTSARPNETAALVLTSVNGAPLFLVIDVGPLDSGGQRQLLAVIPPAAAGLTLGFHAYATSPSGIVDSAREVIEIE